VKAEKKAKELQEERSESRHKVQLKREHVKENKSKIIEEVDQLAYQGYIDYINKKRESTPMNSKFGRNER
jgi:hypothetical protein